MFQSSSKAYKDGNKLKPNKTVSSKFFPKGVDPNVGTIQGRNTFTNTLYATTNNGAGCTETDDETVWFSRNCRAVDKLEGRWWYQKAEQLDVDEERPYAVKGSGK